MDTNFLAQLNTTALFVKGMGILILVLEIVYAVIAFIIIRQVKLMNASFTTVAAPLFELIAKIHLLLSLGLILLTIALL